MISPIVQTKLQHMSETNLQKTRSAIFQAITRAVIVEKTIAQPFRATEVRKSVPGWTYARCFTFLAQNCTDNLPADEALFIRVGKGQYRLNSQ